MAIKELSDGGPDGARLGQSQTDKIGFYGATPVVTPASAGQSAITAGATLVGAVALLIEVRAALVTLGLIKGGA